MPEFALLALRPPLRVERRAEFTAREADAPAVVLLPQPRDRVEPIGCCACALAAERRQLAVLINAYVRKVSFGADFEAHLNFYVESRANFHALDAVQDTLVLGACALAMRVRAAVHGRHTKKTAAFTKACAAFAFITIPTIDAAVLRLRLNLLGAQIALANGLQAQMDAAGEREKEALRALVAAAETRARRAQEDAAKAKALTGQLADMKNVVEVRDMQ